MTPEEEKELLRLTKENNMMLRDILFILRDFTSDSTKLGNLATNFGLGIASNLVGDKIFKSLGLK